MWLQEPPCLLLLHEAGGRLFDGARQALLLWSLREQAYRLDHLLQSLLSPQAAAAACEGCLLLLLLLQVCLTRVLPLLPSLLL
jgi:hypothetical protein